jgi:hypothetical protein
LSYPTPSREGGSRTRDLRLPKPARFQLRYLPALLRPTNEAKSSSRAYSGYGRNRTCCAPGVRIYSPVRPVPLRRVPSSAIKVRRATSTASRTRTPPLRFWRPLLYQLSYRRMRWCSWGRKDRRARSNQRARPKRSRPDLNRGTRLCRPLPNHSATRPGRAAARSRAWRLRSAPSGLKGRRPGH